MSSSHDTVAAEAELLRAQNTVLKNQLHKMKVPPTTNSALVRALTEDPL